MATDRRTEVGARGEQLAASHLERAGYRVLERNYRTRGGELDLVAAGEGCLVFCEVRSRVAARAPPPLHAGRPLESIGPAKRRRVRRMAREWLAAGGSAGLGAPASADSLRFDAIGVTVDARGELLALEHVEDAF